MNLTGGKGWTFDTVAQRYAKMRPSYPDELYQCVLEYSGIGETSEVIEVGIGGGQATLPFLLSGCSLTAVEYGENLSNVCREKFKEFDKFKVITAKFEDVALEDEKYDLIYSATAFHWVPEEIGYKNVYKALKKGGVFARFANHPFICKHEPELSSEIEKLFSLGVEIIKEEKISGVFSGEKIVLTGSLTSFTRDEAKKLIEERGGETSDSVSKAVTLVLAGEKAGSKLEKAKALGIKIIDESQFKLMLKG